MRDRTLFWELFTAFFACMLLISITHAVVKTAMSVKEDVEYNKEKKERMLTLPEECQPYYNDGTDRWKECMGVGYQ